MMNVLTIGLVLTSLLAAAVWSPSPTVHDDHREVIVKEGHRVVVVEYDKEADGSTKVLISPPDVTPDSSKEEKPAEGNILSGPREVVCDAYGKCKHKLATVFGKTKDKVEETVHEVSDKAREVEQNAKASVDKAKKAAGDAVGESLGKAKGGVAQGIEKAKKAAVDTVKDGATKVKNLDVLHSAQTMGGDIGSNVTGKIEDVAKETVESVHKVGDKSLGEILTKLKEVTNDVFWYFLSRDKLDAVVGLVHMLGFSTAYGMGVWVTFISSYILGRLLPKQQFGVVQSRIYPVYYKAMAYSVAAALLGHLASQKKGSLTSMIGFQGSILLSALVMVLTNMSLVEPRATKTMYEKLKIEKEEGRGIGGPTRDGIVSPVREGDAGDSAATVVRPLDNGAATVVRTVVAERPDVMRLNNKLRRWNMYSLALNVGTLMALSWHMAYMGRRLHATR